MQALDIYLLKRLRSTILGKKGFFIFLAVIAGAINIMGIAKQYKEYKRLGGQDQVTRLEMNLAPLMTFLPKEGVIGYISDYKDPVEYWRTYAITQYILAPLMLQTGRKKAELFVGHFKDIPSGVRSYENDYLMLFEDSQSGVVLLRRKAD